MLGPEYRRERNGGIPGSSQDQTGLRGLGILAATTYVSEKDLPFQKGGKKKTIIPLL